MSHIIKKKQDDGLSFNGMTKFYGNIFHKMKEGRAKNLQKKEGIDEETQDDE